MIGLLAIVLTLIIVVGLHETGHAIAAWLTGVSIQRIAIGFGRPLMLWRSQHGCEWAWGMWPLGGYVQLLNSRIQPVEPVNYPVCFDKKPVWVRCFILLAGSFANVIVAMVALTVFYMVGYQHQQPVVQTVAPHSIAATAGMQVNDRIISIANQPTKSWQELGMALLVNLNQSVPVVIERANQQQIITLNLANKGLQKQRNLLAAIGFELNPTTTYQETVAGESLVPVFLHALTKSWSLLVFFMLLIKQFIMGVIPFSFLLGPAAFLTLSAASLSQGIATFLYFIASFSLVVALVNLLPIPGLDGGSLLLAIIEKVRGKPVSVALEVLLYRLVKIAFCLVFLRLILNDVERYLM